MKKFFATFKFTKIQKVAIGIALFGLLGTFVYSNMKPNLPDLLKTDVTMAEYGGIELIDTKDVAKLFPLDMLDYEIADAIHAMSHQKVEADEKWSEMPLTQERVDRLIEVLKAGDFENEPVYFGILNRWSGNDFSRVVGDHNIIWEMKNGTVGEATGILSDEEELLYIEENFDVNK